MVLLSPEWTSREVLIKTKEKVVLMGKGGGTSQSPSNNCGQAAATTTIYTPKARGEEN